VVQQTLQQPFRETHRRDGARVETAGARRSLRAQIAKLERDLAETLVTCFDHASVDLAAAVADAGTPVRRVAYPVRGRGPRLLTLRELERDRDELARRVVAARARLSERAAEHERNRVRLERMLLEPGRHKYERIANRDLGLGGCGVWQVRPRLGLVGMLAGWWEVKLSSGCPLARPSETGGRPICDGEWRRRTTPAPPRHRSRP
jgi:hypothetical protein